MWMTTGGFLRHLVLYNINQYHLSLAWEQIVSQAPHIALVMLAFAAIVLWWRRFLANVAFGSLAAWRDALARDEKVRAMVMVTLYLGLATLMLAGLGKNGSGISYFNEWVGIVSILIGVLVATIAAPSEARGILGGIQIAPILKLALPALLIIQVLRLPAKGTMDFSDEVQTRESDELVDTIARAEKPVLSGDMVVLMLAGKQVPWEPAIFAELASLGRWDESRIIRMIAAREFAFVITRNTMHFTPAVTRAVSAAYPRVKETARHTLHLAPE
jgi:hypothetical protein